jgi:hypothetical protein
MKAITKNILETISSNSLNEAAMDFKVVKKGYYCEENLRYIVANNLNSELSKLKIASFPNENNHIYKIVFQYPYSPNRNSVKKTYKADIALIRSTAERYNFKETGVFYKKYFRRMLFENKIFTFPVNEKKNISIYFNTALNSFCKCSKFDENGFLTEEKPIDDKEVYEIYKKYNDNRIEPTDFEQIEYQGNSLIIELKQFSTEDKIIEDIKRIYHMTDKSRGSEFFKYGLFLTFGFNSMNHLTSIRNYIESTRNSERRILVGWISLEEKQPTTELFWL